MTAVDKSKEKIIVTNTKRNEGMAPMSLGNKFIVGYDAEIHEDDAKEFSYKLPLGAIKRLIKSYYDDIRSIDESGVYQSQSGSYEIRMWPYCYRMLEHIRKQVDKHGLEGKKIEDAVFNQYFKKDYDKMERHAKNHPNQGINDFVRCNDPKCCEPELPSKEKIISEDDIPF